MFGSELQLLQFAWWPPASAVGFIGHSCSLIWWETRKTRVNRQQQISISDVTLSVTDASQQHVFTTHRGMSKCYSQFRYEHAHICRAQAGRAFGSPRLENILQFLPLSDSHLSATINRSWFGSITTGSCSRCCIALATDKFILFTLRSRSCE